MKRFLLMSGLLASVSFAMSQSAVQGIVKDIQTNNPLVGATVTSNQSSSAAVTDAQGHFILRSKKNITSIIVSSIGYDSRQLAITGTSDVLIVLVPSAPVLNPVEVFGEKQSQSNNSLSEADLHRFSGLNLQDAINTVPGVFMQSRTPWGGQHIIIRGYYPSADNGRSNGENFAGLGYQMFIDNIPVTDATGTTVMDDIDFFNLGRVEVIKGPSPLYGNYIAGAVSLFTPRPSAGQTAVQEQAIAGSYGLFRNNIILETSNGKSDFRINYGHQTYEGFRANDASMKDYLTFTSTIAAGEKKTISTYFSYNRSNEGLAGEIDSADFYNRKPISNQAYLLNNSHVNIESIRAGATGHFQFNTSFSNQTTLFTTASTLDQAYAHGFTKDQNFNFGGRTAFNYQGNMVSGTFGGTFQRTNQQANGNFYLPFVSGPFTPSSPAGFPSAAQNYAMNYNVFTQWKFTLAQQLFLVAGAGLNFIEFGTQNMLGSSGLYLNNPVLVKAYSPSFTPALTLLKNFGAGSSVYASASSGYAPATLAQITSSNGSVNTGLKPERAIQYELGTNGNYFNNRLTWQAAIFDMEITDRLIQQTSNSVTSYTNASKERNLGAELNIAYSIINDNEGPVSLLRPWISYSYSHFRYVDFKNYGKSISGNNLLLADYSDNRVAAVPANVFNAGADMSFKNGVYLTATYRFVDKAPVTFDNFNNMKSYSLLSAKAGYRHQFESHLVLDLYACGDNLLGNTYYSMIFVGQNIKELAQGNDPNIPGGGGDGYILPAPYNATFYAGVSLKYIF